MKVTPLVMGAPLFLFLSGKWIYHFGSYVSQIAIRWEIPRVLMEKLNLHDP